MNLASVCLASCLAFCDAACQAEVGTCTHRGSSLLQVEVNHELNEFSTEADSDGTDPVCHGCLWHKGCDAQATRNECDASGGIWHQEDEASALTENEIAEFTQMSALDFDEDGVVSVADLKILLVAMGEQPTEQSLERLKKRVDAVTEGDVALFDRKRQANVMLAQAESHFFKWIIAIVKVVADAVEHVADGGNIIDWGRDYAIEFITDPCNATHGAMCE